MLIGGSIDFVNRHKLRSGDDHFTLRFRFVVKRKCTYAVLAAFYRIIRKIRPSPCSVEPERGFAFSDITCVQIVVGGKRIGTIDIVCNKNIESIVYFLENGIFSERCLSGINIFQKGDSSCSRSVLIIVYPLIAFLTDRPVFFVQYHRIFHTAGFEFVQQRVNFFSDV